MTDTPDGQLSTMAMEERVLRLEARIEALYQRLRHLEEHALTTELEMVEPTEREQTLTRGG